MSIRRNDMSQWIATAWRCNDLKQAMEAAMRFQNIAKILIWPMPGYWLLVKYTELTVN